MANELKPCPFCGGKEIRFDCHKGKGRGIWHSGDDVWSMCCYGCGATFPNAYNKERLVSDWNRRTPKETGANLSGAERKTP